MVVIVIACRVICLYGGPVRENTSPSDTDDSGLPATGRHQATGSPDAVAPGFAQSQRAALAAMISLANTPATTPPGRPARASQARRSLAARPAGRAGSPTAPPPRRYVADRPFVPMQRYGVDRATGLATSRHTEGEMTRSVVGARSVSRVIALIPAHNEAATIGETIRSLRQQTRPPDRIIVVCDNCSDNTADLSLLCGAEVILTVGNTDRKAGALNQALARVLPHLERNDLLLAMDADSSLSPGWLATAADMLIRDQWTGAVCGVFLGEPGGGLVGQIQRNEYCQPPGTMVTTVTTAGSSQHEARHEDMPIEALKAGDKVVSLKVRGGGGWITRNGRAITDVAVRHFAGDLVTVRTTSGLSSRYTPEHWCAIRFGDFLRDKHVVYLMRKGNNYRIGKAKGLINQEAHAQLGFMTRFNREQADDIWILSYHDTSRDALKAEQEAIWRYKIPGLRWQAVLGQRPDGISQADLDSLWDEIGGNAHAAALVLEAHGQRIDLPLWGRKHNPQDLALRDPGVNFINAIHLRDGMEVVPLRNNRGNGWQVISDWEPISVAREPYEGPVHSIEVEGTHTYFADGIATHNCRYASIVERRWQALVLSGTGTLFRVHVLREIARKRGTARLPGVRGQYYNHASITEDDEITLAVKTLGWKCRCPPACETTTEVMPTWKALWIQRMRWQKGTLGDLRAYGVSRVTWSYWARQAGLYGGFAASFACLLIMIGTVLVHPGLSVAWTAAILSVTLVERTWTVRRAGWRGVLLAASILPEAGYALFQGWLFFSALRADMLRREIAWGHVLREGAS